ncbi:hypothetical protein TVAG_048960 [Trichomonas vaginalis G3]|uniref:Uncharacterized protein n=1 Tax=Trichomonas vaginalis (strain ATCC PRA-98 / G3) TaxID=412133 RepID=A2G1W3_TRIV3|nr:WD repeat-containing protein 11 family [Trichomonas vaginalis G3]EAX88842.1 hypothetical protein TVAG_048960 [Trichomonas vaginalis G3]KAI5515528.1 WD repeat-containing protein 11 family [Trichomonas vaginalis G3]|eukprot:XP_001301772.1 hypothetical protein [Trichomonas vaginalis G3]
MSFEIIPEFPPAAVKDNAGAIDWDMDNVIAYASGCVVHLCYIVDGKLQRAGSIDVAPNVITSVSIHSEQRLIAIGDSEGRVVIYHVDKHQFIASSKSFLSDKVYKLRWFGEYLFVLYSSSHLSCYAYKPGNTSDNLHNLQEYWTVSLPFQCTNFSIDPNTYNYILFSGSFPKFSIFSLKAPHIKPEPYFEVIELTTPDEILDSQWSYHAPGFIFIVTGREIMFFHMETKTLISLFVRKTTSAQFTKLIQFYNNHKRLITLHKNGGMTIFDSPDSFFKYQITTEISPKHCKSTILTACSSITNDDYICLYYNNIGISLFDINNFQICSACPIFPSNVTSFDCDGTVYCYGTDQGSIICGNVYNVEDLQKFTISQNSGIIFVSINSTLRNVYFQTNESLGVIDLSSKTIQKFQTKYGEVMNSKCFSSHFGTFIVARDKFALGVFIKQKEVPVLLQTELVDVSVDELFSSQENGRFAVLDKNSDIFVYEYSKSKDNEIKKSKFCLNAKMIYSEPTAICFNGNTFIISFQNGLILTLIDEKNLKQFQTKYSGIIKLKYVEGLIFGLTKNFQFFVISLLTEEIRECPFNVKDFCQIDTSIVMVLTDDKVLRFLRLSDFKPISLFSSFMKLESKSDNCKRQISLLKNFKGFMSEYAKDVYNILTNNECLRLQQIIGFVNSDYRKVYDELISHLEIKDKDGQKFIFLDHLFRGDFEYCSTIVQSEHEDYEDKYFENSLLGCLLLTMKQNDKEMDNKTLQFIETSAISLLSFHKFFEGCCLFRLFGLDKKGFDSFIEYGDIYYSSLFCKFVMKEKESYFNLACLFLDSFSYQIALILFAKSGEFHPVLDILSKMGCEIDAHFLFIYLSDKGLLHELSPRQMAIAHGVETLDKVVEKIEIKFAEISQ